MIIKLLGGMIIILSFYGYGWYMAEYTKKRIDELMGFRKAFMLFSAEMAYGGGTLWEIFEGIGKRCTGCSGKTFLNMSELLYEKAADGAEEAWRKSVAGNTVNSFLADEDINNLTAFGRCIGFSDYSAQASNVNISLSYIDDKTEELKNKYAEQSRLYKSLGAISGLLMVIVIF